MSGDIKLRLASSQAPHIQALLDGTYYFFTEKEAQSKLSYLKEQFITSKHTLPEPPDAPYLVMWIRDFDVTQEEREAFYKGNFALVTLQPHASEEGYTLLATKIPTALDHHPSKGRPPMAHPDWRHPFLRLVRQGKHYAGLDEVQQQYQLLGAQFPKSVIPCTNKCYVMLYEKGQEPPLQKYILTTEAVKQGGFTVAYQKNNYQAPTKAELSGKNLEAVGLFTSKVMLNKKPDTP